MGIHMGLSDDSILDKYSEVRRKIWSDVIDPASRENLRRPHEQEASTARENDEFFKLCVRAEADEGRAGELAMVGFSFFFFFSLLPLYLGGYTNVTRDWRC